MSIRGIAISAASLRSPRRRPGRRPPLLLLAPALFVACGALLPVAYLALRALGVPDAAAVVLSPKTLIVLGRTLALAAAVTAASIALALPLARLTVRTDLPLRRLWAVMVVMPLAIPSYVGGFTMVAALGPRGLLQQALSPLGIHRLPEIYGFFGAWLTLTLVSYPYALLTIRAALRGLDASLDEAARGLGCTPGQVFWRVTLPQLRPGIAAGGLLVALYVLSDFGAVSLLQMDTFSRAIYVQYRGALDRGLAAVLSMLLVLVTLIVLAVEARARGRLALHRSGGTRRPPALLHLGPWRWPGLALCAGVGFLGVGLPLLVSSIWLLHGLAQGEPVRFLWRPLANSVTASSLAAGVTVLAALCVALVALRYPSRWTATLERATYTGFALPPIVTALGLVFFSARYTPWLYQTLVLLVFAYTIRFTPQAVAPIRAALLQVSPQLEEAGRSLGHRPTSVAWRVALPLVRPGVVAGAALVFLTAMKELPATLLLSPTGFSTLATHTWWATTEAYFSQAAASALLLVGVSALSLALVLAGERSGWSA